MFQGATYGFSLDEEERDQVSMTGSASGKDFVEGGSAAMTPPGLGHAKTATEETEKLEHLQHA